MVAKFNKIINGKQPVLVYFYATWCRHCKKMPPIIKEVKAKLGDDIRIVKVDIDKEILLATKYKVKSVPTVALFRTSQLHWRKAGVLHAKDIVKRIKPFLPKKEEQKQSSR